MLARVLVLLAALSTFSWANGQPTPVPHQALPSSGTAPSGPIQVTRKTIDSPLDDIQWADLRTVFVLTEKGKLYRSSDSGKGWTDQQGKLHATNPAVRSMHISKVDPRKIFLMGRGKENWLTTDMGRTYLPAEHLDLHEVRMHPRQPNWLLGASMSDGCRSSPKSNCYKVLYYSKDLGRKWHLATTYAVQFDWAPVPGATKSKKTMSPEEVSKIKEHPPHTEDDLVYATVHTLKVGNQKFGQWDKNIHFYQTYDYFKTHVETVPHGNRFLFGEHNYLFVAAVNPRSETEVSLQVSRDTGAHKRFTTAILPVDLTEHSYTILDTSEGSVFLHVNHAPFDTNAPTGHVYISDWSGTKFSLSLPYNHRSPDGKCDFEKVEGLEGIYLANFIDEEEEDRTNGAVADGIDQTGGSGGVSRGAGGNANKRLKAKTVITFDKGGIWSYLEPPKTDAEGKPVQCGKDCHLHLHGITDLYGPFYSSGTAVGIIMSTGTIGKYLQDSMDKINTYLSRDAGLSWYEVAKGSHIYEFGDHGGLIVMAYDEGETDTVMYSWDQGVTWKSVRISQQPMQVENIIIEPEATSQQFVVYGWQDTKGVLVFLDFAELHERQCLGHDAPDTATSDYEIWTPSDGRLGGKCLLGHRATYTRRKRTAQCFNPEKHEKLTMHEHCACTAEDFECDYGYMRKTQQGPCVKDPDADPLPHEKCKDFYHVTKGYRRVSGDSCIGGGQWDRVQVPCPSWAGSHIGKVILLLLATVVVSLAVATFYGKSSFIEGTVDWLKSKFGKDSYHMIGRGGKLPESMADDDFGLDDSDFGQSAQLIRDVDRDDDESSEFQPLPERRVRASAVPTLSGPK